MGLRRGSTLVCSVNISGGARGTINARLHATTWNPSQHPSRPNSEALAARVVLAHLRVAFHPCTCELRRGVATIAVALIDYDEIKVAVKTTTSTPTRNYIGSLLPLFFCCSAHLVVTIYDLLLTSILGWHSRSSASVAYPYPYIGIRAALRNSWSGSCAMVICHGY
jgi:hypothetical protein